MNAITLDRVTKIYRRYGGRHFATLKSALLQRSILRDLQPNETFPALTDVTFSVPKGATYGVMGRNGSGKSTALKLVAGITRGLFTGDLPRHWQSLLAYDTKLLELDWSKVETG